MILLKGTLRLNHALEDTYYINVFYNMFFTVPNFGLDNLLENIH